MPDGTTGTAGVVLLTKVGGAGITVGLDVTRGATGTVDATSTGEAEVTTGTTGAVVATSAGEVAIGVGTAVTGLVTVQGQSVIVRGGGLETRRVSFPVDLKWVVLDARPFASQDHSNGVVFLAYLSHNVG